MFTKITSARLLAGTAGLLPLWILVISTAVAVFGRNAEEFYPAIELFATNLTLLAGIAALWMLLAVLWLPEDRTIRLSLGLTVGVMAYTIAVGRTPGQPHQLYWLILASATIPPTVVAARFLPTHAIRDFLLASLVLIIAWDVASFGRVTLITPQSDVSTIGATTASSRTQLPNIYHFVFDAFQNDVFRDISLEGAAPELGGFTWFRNTAATSADTVSALAEIFSSRDADRFLWTQPDWTTQRDAFYRDAHGGGDSLKPRLKRLGYHTVGHVYYRTQYAHFSEGFDAFVPHSAYVEGAPAKLDDSRLFFHLWLVSILPPQLSDSFVPDIANQRLTGRATMSRFPSLVSYGAVAKFIGAEYSQPAKGRYVFFHVLLPHKPFIFSESCETDENDWGDTPSDAAVRGQYGCAQSLIRDIIGTLKRIDRFDDSMIIVQGDHGDGFRKNGSGQYQRVIDQDAPDTFTRPVLLVKPPREPGALPLRISDFPARAPDVARTILASVDPAGAGNMKGIDLLRETELAESRRRFFYWEAETHTLRYEIGVDGGIAGRDKLKMNATTP
jgi:Sulfatase